MRAPEEKQLANVGVEVMVVGKKHVCQYVEDSRV
jgi:hypothetical protein